MREWQERLGAHFAELRDSRIHDDIVQPVFGLEHGLDPEEVLSLEHTARSNLRHRGPSRSHFLVWVVYSSEIGYKYSGDEYWQTFERETPGWDQNEYRYRLQDFFRRFQTVFGGAVPSGLWADHFSIISWPITHAILPKDLQLQLARTLYILRNQYSRDVLESTEALGELIATRSWDSTSRFKHFVQEKQLAGQIAIALLLQDEPEASNLIHLKTLRRIREDLDRERQARNWLQRARQYAGERVRAHSLGLPRRSIQSPNVGRLDETRKVVMELGIEPRLILRPGDTAGGSWDVSLEIPNLSHVLSRFPQTSEVLSGSRCTVAGSSGRPLARGRLLYGQQRIPLSLWPRWDEVLLKFEQNDPQLDFLLRTECLLRPGPKWLFRIASDGLAYECRSLRVRPGERYILVSSTVQEPSSQHHTSTKLNCEGVHGSLLELPDALSMEWEEALRQFGLEQSRTVEVSPAGLAPAAWDGEGYGEWPETEAPCLCILSDHPLAALNVSIETVENGIFELTSVDPGEPVFLELPQLPVGVHRVQIAAQSMANGDSGQLGTFDFVICIREERPESQIVSPIVPLEMRVDPPSPTLEQLWEAGVDLSLQGPTDRTVEIDVVFDGSNGESPAFAQRLPPIHLPFQPDDWRSHFRAHFQDGKEAQEAYDIARGCTLAFDAGELGKYEVHFGRAFAPLRWAVRRRRNGYLVHLIDDRGDPDPAAISRWAFETPCVEESLASHSGPQVQVSGGLLVAGSGEFSTAIIVPPAPNRLRLGDLRLVPRIQRNERSMDTVVRLVEILGLWSKARLTGDFLSAIHQRSVLRGLLGELFQQLCGDRWARAERQAAARCTPDSLRALADAISQRREDIGLGTSLWRKSEEFARASCDERVGLLGSLLTEYHLAEPPHGHGERHRTLFDTQDSASSGSSGWIAEFSLRLTTDPGNLANWASDRLRPALARLYETPTLAKAARYLVLAADCYSQADSRLSGPGPYDGWRWE